MNKLDQLLLLVEGLELRSETLMTSLNESTLLMENICKNNSSVSTFDLNIESVNESIRNNYDYHLQFIELVGKTDLFESSISHNDYITNHHSLSNLEAESSYLRKKYAGVRMAASDIGVHVQMTPGPQQREKEPQYAPYDGEISRSASMLDMNLKPIRCKNTQVCKKKSRYRISKVFNINPLSYDDTSDLSHTPINTSFGETTDVATVTNENNAHEANPSDSTFFDNSDDKLSLLNPIEFSVDDDISILSDVSTTPPKYTSIENFESFLRKSRINLNSASYPFVLKKSVSEESLVPQKINIPPIINHKFHNPIDKIKQTSLESITPTIELIYSSTNKGDTNSKKLLNEVINSSSKPQFSLFNFALISPERPRRAPEAQPCLQRRKSIIGKSLTESFLMLMNNDLPPPPHPPHDRPALLKRRKSDKLERLKSVPKTKPISIKSDNYLKRVPLSQGSYSSITVDSNKSFVMSHGHGSLFKKPVVTSFSNRSLQEALNTSISF